MATLVEQKQELRSRVRKSRAALSSAEREAGNKALAQRLLALPEVQSAHVIGVYRAYGSEPSLLPLIETLRASESAPKIVYPVVLGGNGAMVFAELTEAEADELLSNPKAAAKYFDTNRAVDPEALDVMLTPCVAFDKTGRRLGQGGGYYDRYLPRLRKECAVIGIAYDVQVVDEIPCEPHDMRVSAIATPTRIIRCEG